MITFLLLISAGNSKPTAETLLQIRKKYGIDLNWLLVDEIEQDYIQKQEHFNVKKGCTHAN